MIVSRGIYIDDAGTPGVQSKSKFLPEDRKSYCAVIVPGEVAHQVSIALDIFLNGVKKDYGAEELHFTDIYSGRGVWKKVTVEDRIKVFDLMLMIMSKFRLPVFFQTSSETFEISKMAQLTSIEGEWWNLSNTSHQALLFLIHVIANELRTFRRESSTPPEFREPFEVIVDEGLMKPGAQAELPSWSDVVLDKKLIFSSSASCPGLQLADFAAFCISRAQWISARIDPGSRSTPADLHILDATGRLNIWNLPMLVVDRENYSRGSYEWAIMKDRKNKGLPVIPKSDNKK